jgi:hypothetical protein
MFQDSSKIGRNLKEKVERGLDEANGKCGSRGLHRRAQLIKEKITVNLSFEAYTQETHSQPQFIR